MRVAAIDIGTNSVLLLVAERRGGELVAVVDRATITRLGQGVDKARALAPEAVERTLACLAGYADELRALGAQRVDVVGTSAMRDAVGGEAFRVEAGELLGTVPRVVSGDEEARLTFEGSLIGLDVAAAATVFDLGGGSTEVILGDASGRPGSAVSLDLGSVRLTERHVRSDPPSPAELAAIRADARAALATLPERPASGGTLVGVAGTVTTLAAVARGVAPYDAARVHGARLSTDELERTTASLAAMPVALRRTMPGLDPGRADVIVAGALIVDELCRWAGATELVVSDRGVRWGLAARLLAHAGGA